MKNKKMYATAIDASKAFDKVNRLLLWLIMFEKVGFAITYILMKYYENSKAYITNKNELSPTFNTTVGVKQGGPLSPRLFAIYIQDMENIIDASKIGVKIGDLIINLLLYADDIILISSTKKEMQTLIDTVEQFGHSKEIKFNPSKTNYIGINEYVNIRSTKYMNDIQFIRMNGEIIESVSSLKYLGSYLSENLLNKDHLKERYRMTASAVDKLVKNSGFHNIHVSVAVKLQLYKSYVRPVLTYGLETMLLGTKEMSDLQTKEENIIKTSLGLSTRLSSTELMLVLGLNRLELRLDSLLPSFFGRLLKNEYTRAVIENLSKEERLHRKSITRHIFAKFKTKNTQQLLILCEPYKNIIDKNFEYEVSETKEESELPNLLKNLRQNMHEIVQIMRVF